MIHQGNRLAGENQSTGAIGAMHGGHEGTGGFFGIAGADDIEAGDNAQTAHCFHGLVGWAVFTDTHGIMRKNVGNGEFRKCGEADRGAHVIGEYKESRAGRAEQAIVGDAVADGTHGVLADAVPNVPA